MKNYLLILAINIFMLMSLSAQTVSYCEVSSTSYSNIVTVDFGQTKIRSSKHKLLILDDSKQGRRFNSKIDALNFLTMKGWELFEIYTVEESHEVRYLLTWDLSKGEPFIPEVKEVKK